MTHATHNQEKLDTGLALGKLISDQETRSALKDELGTSMTVYADTADTVHLVIPAGIDQAKLAQGDEAYFEELGRQALGACMYDDLPK
jgi:hypothetical protein